MEISNVKFQQRLIESQLTEAEAVRDYLIALQAGKGSVTEQEFANALVVAGALTPFQVKAIYQGEGENLVLRNYVILDKIGKGGMGRIYRGKHRRMDRIVALKFLPPEMTNQDDAVLRFHREVKAAARLAHPNIVMAYDADVENGLHFMVMEYVEGTDLASIIKQQGKLSVEQAVDYVCQAARGLEFAHRQNVIHRDIKPGNLILDQFGIVKVLDMGLARFNDSIRSASSIDLTKSNMAIGTVDFMSPEQAFSSKYVDERGDIYSLGMTLYFLLTGQPAYGGETAVERVIAHRDSPLPSLANVQRDGDGTLNAIFQKMVAKKPDERYQSMSEVIEALSSQCSGTKLAPVQITCLNDDRKRNSVLLNLKAIPSFVSRPQFHEAPRGTNAGASESKKTEQSEQLVDFDLSADLYSFFGNPPLAANTNDPTIRQFTKSHKLLSLLAITLLVAAAMIFKLGG